MKKQLLFVALLGAGVMNVEARMNLTAKKEAGQKAIAKLRGWVTKSKGSLRKILGKALVGVHKFKYFGGTKPSPLTIVKDGVKVPNFDGGKAGTMYTTALTVLSQLVEKYGNKGLEKINSLIDKIPGLPADLTLPAKAFLETAFDSFLEKIQPGSSSPRTPEETVKAVAAASGNAIDSKEEMEDLDDLF